MAQRFTKPLIIYRNNGALSVNRGSVRMQANTSKFASRPKANQIVLKIIAHGGYEREVFRVSIHCAFAEHCDLFVVANSIRTGNAFTNTV